MRLEPSVLARYAKAGLYDDCQKYHIDYCSNCGACVDVCPAKIPLLLYINTAKRELTKEAANNVREMAVCLEKEVKSNEVKSEAKIKKFYPIVFIVMLVAIMLTLFTFTESLARVEIQSHLDQKTLGLPQEIFPKISHCVLEEDTYIIYDNGRNEIGYAFYGEGWGYGGKMEILVGLEDK